MTKTALTRDEIVALAHISHSSFKIYVASGAVVEHADSTPQRRLYDPVSVENIKRQKIENKDSRIRARGLVRRREILEQTGIHDPTFAHYVSLGIITRVCDSTTGHNPYYTKESVENVLQYKAKLTAEKQAKKALKEVTARAVKTPKETTTTVTTAPNKPKRTVEDLELALTTLSKKMLSRITELEARVKELERDQHTHAPLE